MRITYAKHAEEKLNRLDIKKFRVTKKLINSIIAKTKHASKTKSGEHFTLYQINEAHSLRIISVIIKDVWKVITFHITRKGRYNHEN